MVRSVVGWFAPCHGKAGCAAVGLAWRRRLAVKAQRHATPDTANNRESDQPFSPVWGLVDWPGRLIRCPAPDVLSLSRNEMRLLRGGRVCGGLSEIPHAHPSSSPSRQFYSLPAPGTRTRERPRLQRDLLPPQIQPTGTSRLPRGCTQALCDVHASGGLAGR